MFKDQKLPLKVSLEALSCTSRVWGYDDSSDIFNITLHQSPALRLAGTLDLGHTQKLGLRSSTWTWSLQTQGTVTTRVVPGDG